jgi:hypothetical protein
LANLLLPVHSGVTLAISSNVKRKTFRNGCKKKKYSRKEK